MRAGGGRGVEKKVGGAPAPKPRRAARGVATSRRLNLALIGPYRNGQPFTKLLKV